MPSKIRSLLPIKMWTILCPIVSFNLLAFLFSYYGHFSFLHFLNSSLIFYVFFLFLSIRKFGTGRGSRTLKALAYWFLRPACTPMPPCPHFWCTRRDSNSHCPWGNRFYRPTRRTVSDLSCTELGG